MELIASWMEETTWYDATYMPLVRWSWSVHPMSTWTCQVNFQPGNCGQVESLGTGTEQYLSRQRRHGTPSGRFADVRPELMWIVKMSFHGRRHKKISDCASQNSQKGRSGTVLMVPAVLPRSLFSSLTSDFAAIRYLMDFWRSIDVHIS